MKGQLRIIGGEYKRKKLLAPDNIRPTKNIVRQAIFNIIGPYLYHKSFIDLFAGSASVGIEAISRGASPVFFVEENANATDIINKNIQNIAPKSSVKAFNCDAMAFVSLNTKSFDYVFVDPPYTLDASYYNTLLPKLISVLEDKSTLIVEHPTKIAIEIPSLELVRKKKYGISSLSFFVKHKKTA